MPEFTKGEGRALESCVEKFAVSFRANVADVLKKQFRGAQPPEVNEVLEQLSLVAQQLAIKQKPLRVHDAHSSLLKRIVIDQRRAAAEAIEAPLQRAIALELVHHLQRELRPLEEIMNAPWFTEARAMRLPRLTDYLSIRFAEAALPDPPMLAPREFDEKFTILEAPALFLKDLAYYRFKGALRDAPLAVAYADIDDFKSLNTRYTETAIDLRVLPRFMEALEAHVFAHGHAYRFGGDEYVLLLPNTSETSALAFVGELQARLAMTRYGLPVQPSLSVGLCPIDADCMLTDREVLGRANGAKNTAKAVRKGSIASYRGALYREEDLYVPCGVLAERGQASAS